MADGDPVGAWDDLSGLGTNTVQATLAKQPTLKQSIQNGRSVIRFDGVDDCLRTVTLGSPTAQPFTIIGVFAPTNASNTNVFYDAEAGTAMAVYHSAGSVMHIQAPTDVGTTSGTVDTTWHVWTVTFNGASSAAWKDGSSIFSGNPGAHAFTGLTVGGTRGGQSFSGVQGDEAEFIVYSRALNTLDRQAVERHLGTRWGITVA